MKKDRGNTRLFNEPIPKKKEKKRYCGLCKVGIHYVDFKNPEFLKRFLNEQGKILPPVYTGNCRRHQLRVAMSIKRARQVAILPYLTDNFK